MSEAPICRKSAGKFVVWIDRNGGGCAESARAASVPAGEVPVVVGSLKGGGISVGLSPASPEKSVKPRLRSVAGKWASDCGWIWCRCSHVGCSAGERKSCLRVKERVVMNVSSR